MKVTVYAICKNESKFARRWAESMSEADAICVLDTGSTDDTVARLRECGVTVAVKKIEPWRFDTARNESLKLVPADTDICVCTDLDEVFRPGWRKLIERAWTPDTHRLKYRYTWSHTPSGEEGVVFYIEKIHAYGCYAWVCPVHEVLSYTGAGSETVRLAEAGYLPLLELDVAEQPQIDRNIHDLGREYMYQGRWDDAIRTLTRHLALPTAVWADERCASMRFIAKCYAAKNEPAAAEQWLLQAIAQAPHLREPSIDMATLCYNREDWAGTAYFVHRALAITERSMSYINEPQSWSSYPYDIASVALYRLGLLPQAAAFARHALALSPDDERIKNNLQLINGETVK